MDHPVTDYSVAVVAEVDAPTGDDVPKALVSLEPNPDHRLHHDSDFSPSVRDDGIVYISLDVSAPAHWPADDFLRAFVETPSVRLESGGGAIVADSATGGPPHEPRPPGFTIDEGGTTGRGRAGPSSWRHPAKPATH